METINRAGQLYNEMNRLGSRQAAAAEAYLAGRDAEPPPCPGTMSFCRILSVSRSEDDDRAYASRVAGFYAVAAKLGASVLFLWQSHDDGTLTCDIGVDAQRADELTRAFADQVRGIAYTAPRMPRPDPAHELWGMDGLSMSAPEDRPPRIDDALGALKPGCALLLVLNPISPQAVSRALERADRHASTLSLFHRLSCVLGATRVRSRASGTSDADALTRIQTTTASRNASDTHTRQSGSAQGSNTGLHSFLSMGSNNSTNQGASVAHSTGESTAENSGTTTGRTRTVTATETTGTNDTENMNASADFSRVGAALRQLARRRSRLHRAQISGMSTCAVYAFAPAQKAQVILATVNAQSAGRGEDGADMDLVTGIRRAGGAQELLRMLETGRHVPGFGTAALPGEIPPFLPMREMRGFPVDRSAAYARNVVLRGGADTIRIGVIVDGERETDRPVELDIDEFTSHIIAAGATGSGKTTALCNLVNQTMRRRPHVHILAIDPKNTIRPGDFVGGATLYTTRTDLNQNILRLQPFAVPDGVSLASHIDHLAALFESCWSMSAAMPDILKQAVFSAYRRCGWDIACGIRVAIPGMPQWPDFAMLEEETRAIICRGGFSERTRSDYLGALCTRLHSLSTNVCAEIFRAENTVPFEELYDRNVIVHCGSVSGETLSLIMSVLLLGLVEYRQSAAAGRRNLPLQHMTLFEEAHALAPRRDFPDGNKENASIGGKSSEAITKLLAQARDMGEACILSNQTIHEISRQAVENTATKLVFQIQGRGDIEDLAAALALDPAPAQGMSQALGLARLEKYHAVVCQRGWRSLPVKARMDDNPLSGDEQQEAGGQELRRWWAGQVVRVLCCAQSTEQLRAQMQTLLEDKRIAGQLRQDTRARLNDCLQAEERDRAQMAGRLLLSFFDQLTGILLAHYGTREDELYRAVLGNLDRYADVRDLTPDQRRRIAREILAAERARGTLGE